jgi:hypothetical protein
VAISASSRPRPAAPPRMQQCSSCSSSCWEANQPPKSRPKPAAVRAASREAPRSRGRGAAPANNTHQWVGVSAPVVMIELRD